MNNDDHRWYDRTMSSDDGKFVHPTLKSAIDGAVISPGIHIGDVHESSTIRFETKNSTYTVSIINVIGSIIKVESTNDVHRGPFECRLNGSLLGLNGSTISPSVIRVGYAVEFGLMETDEETSLPRRIVTTRVRRLWVDDVPVVCEVRA